MEIRIVTDGYKRNTKVEINGQEIKDLKEFHFSVNPDKKIKDATINGKAKMQMGLVGDFRSYFADDFQKYDEATIERVK